MNPSEVKQAIQVLKDGVVRKGLSSIKSWHEAKELLIHYASEQLEAGKTNHCPICEEGEKTSSLKERCMLDTLNDIGKIVGLPENYLDGDELIKRVEELSEERAKQDDYRERMDSVMEELIMVLPPKDSPASDDELIREAIALLQAKQETLSDRKENNDNKRKT